MNDQQNNTPEKRKPEAKHPAPEASANASTVAGEIQKVLSLLKPLTDFHKAVEDASEHDCRLFWDVRLVSGNATPLIHVHGTSSLPSLLSPKTLHHAATTIEREVNEKITGPLVSFFMTEVDKAISRSRLASCQITKDERSIQADRESPSDEYL